MTCLITYILNKGFTDVKMYLISLCQIYSVVFTVSHVSLNVSVLITSEQRLGSDIKLLWCPFVTN